MPASDDIQAIAVLEEPVRRRLYEWTAAQRRPVSRDEAATAVGISRALAAFHLDRLAAGGLLAVEFRRLSGRTGPGAGRPAKLYQRAERDISVSLPDRRYSVPAEIMASALEQTGEPVPPPAVQKVAHAAGEAAGIAARAEAGSHPSAARLEDALVGALAARGYEPQRTTPGEIRLLNCPFHALAQTHRDLVCGMNLSLAEGILDGLGTTGYAARLDPQPGWCCVALARRSPGAGLERKSRQSTRS